MSIFNVKLLSMHVESTIEPVSETTIGVKYFICINEQ